MKWYEIRLRWLLGQILLLPIYLICLLAIVVFGFILLDCIGNITYDILFARILDLIMFGYFTFMFFFVTGLGLYLIETSKGE